MNIVIHQVDAFTTAPFSGNPAAVCLLDRFPDDGWLLDVAREMNLSETAFLVDNGAGFDLRWFTPATEVDLCGHATLASAHVLKESGRLKHGDDVVFSTHSGPLKATIAGASIELDFPATPVETEEAPGLIREALGVSLRFAGKSRFDYLVEVQTDDLVRNLDPDLGLLKGLKSRGVIVTAASSDPRYDFISRFFAPGAGIDEDPVTGSAHCVLGPYWKPRLGKDEFLAYQASPRGGEVGLRLQGDRVVLTGQAVTVLTGDLFVPLPS